ncbi:ABC transporter substrate-binding protein [Patulibacter sp. S7RM1-6]
MTPTSVRTALAVGALLPAALGLAACGGDDDNDSASSSGGSATTSASSGGGGEAKTIALLLPESKTARYEALDHPLFEAKLKADCPDCKLIYSNADQDASKQQSQAESAITNGADVLVLDPVDAKSAGAIVTRAKTSSIPVVSYDRLISDADVDYYISFDNEKVGELQGQSLVEALGDPKGKSIVMINGAPTDSNAAQFKKGAHSVLDPSGVKIAKEYDTPDWSPDKAQTEMEQAITAVGKNNIDGVYAANDGNAGGAIAAMKSAGIDPAKVPVTGQDAELAGVQRVISGEQYMTIYKQVKPEAENAVTLALAAARGQQPPAGLVKTKTNNGSKDVPTVILDAIAVTQKNLKDTIIKDGLYPTSKICTKQYAADCKKLGLSETR